jgi:4-hydroxy-tetrahydrodipicolinate reductase
MQIKVNGSGKMGTMVRRIAESRGHSIAENLHHEFVCIDFTHPSAVVKNIREAAAYGTNIVVGTTGWDEHYDEVKKLVADAGIAMLYSPNFSIGAHLYKQICLYAAKLVSQYDQYHVALHETHHSQKVDAPSGTALKLQSALKPHYSELPITSFRHGYNPGNHTLIFDAPEDTISISHQARGREGFALGAVIAAEFLKGKKGIYTLDDLI